jgi:hypothetical protein
MRFSLDSYIATEMPSAPLAIVAEDDGMEWHIFQRAGDGKFLARPYIPGDGYPSWDMTLYPTFDRCRASLPV